MIVAVLGAGEWDWNSSDRAGGGEAMPGIRWMQLLTDHFDRTAWLNPDEPHYWRGGTAEMLAKVFPMFPLTLDGLGDAIAHLSKGQPRRA